VITRWYHWSRGKSSVRLLILEVHSPKSCHELSRVKVLVHGEHKSFAINCSWCHITFRCWYVGRGYISSFVGWLLGKPLAITSAGLWRILIVKDIDEVGSARLLTLVIA
jgi:hypothetical protein